MIKIDWFNNFGFFTLNQFANNQSEINAFIIILVSYINIFKNNLFIYNYLRNKLKHVLQRKSDIIVYPSARQTPKIISNRKNQQKSITFKTKTEKIQGWSRRLKGPSDVDQFPWTDFLATFTDLTAKM